MTDRRAIQRFEILAVLGDGGMGTVYRARDPQLEREVAIKILHDATSGVRSALNTEHTLDLRGRGGTKRRDDLMSEARMMARLSHPNVVPIYEVGLDDRGDVFVVMEYVAGEDLRSWLEADRTPIELARVFAQAARGLAAAHERGIVHRDFKPDNVLIGSDGRARVGDFGISKLAEPTGLVMTAKVAGTPKYMAPELWRGEAATPASDVFALCTTILDAYGVREDVHRTLVERGLAKRPQDRPSLGELIAALEGHAPRRRTHRVAAVALAGAAIGTSVAFAMQTETGPSCDTDVIGDRWDTTKRAAFRDSMTGAAAEVARVLGVYDARAHEIATLAREVCRGSGDRLTTAQAQQQTSCLELRAIELGAITERQIEKRTDVIQAELRFNKTSLPASCASLSVAVPSPAALAPVYARFHGDTEAGAKAIEQFATIERDARTAGDLELAVRAAVWVGTYQRQNDRSGASDETLQRAHTEAMAISCSECATNALSERLLTAGNSRDIAQTKTLGVLGRDAASKPGTTLRARLRLLRALGRTTQARGEHRAAIDISRGAIDEAARSAQRNLDVEMLLRHDIAESMLLINERIPEAIAIAKEAVALAERLGTRTNNYGIALGLLAKAYMLQGDLDQALVFRRQALEVWQRVFPPTHSAVLEGRVDLAILLKRASRFEEADRELVDAVALAGKSEAMKRVYPWMLSRLAMTKAELGKHEEALRLLDESIELLGTTVGVDHPQTYNQRINYAIVALELGRLDAVERVVNQLEKSFARKPVPGDKYPALVRGWIAAELALARNNPTQAEALARSAVDELAELQSDEELAIAQRHLADALVVQGRFAEAKPLVEAALASARAQKLRADDVAAYEVTLASVELGLGDRDAARLRAAQLVPVLERYPLQRNLRAKLARLQKR